MAKQRGRPKEQPDDLVYLRLAVTPEEHRLIQVAAGLAGLSMAQFARRTVAEAARARVVAAGMDPARMPPPEEGGTAAEGGGAGAGVGRSRRRRKAGEG